MAMKEGDSLLQARVPVSVHQMLKTIAQQQERSVTWVVNKILAEAAAKAAAEIKQ